MKKILVVCSNGLGSSLMLKSNIQKVLQEKKVEAEVENCDLGSAGSLSKGMDLVVTSQGLAGELEGLGIPVVTITNFISKQEVEEKVLSRF
ncbi:PTS sugar transporter subunit IIB [Desmospora activa]|uniref:PTS system ascorbate-specific IIB component n=1 Tax=Desmospora activa DSM 45169 TaxID=1121389 RepID=A0A2T4ZCD4_9BACL|nr:PTS sugar transporter subunit IIB [Desmospora activa]PTM59529.1 PTS system ascorbate-specific IIB component [Desmospora activa DSM 45169]